MQFDEQYDQVTALEYALAALGVDLVNGLRLAARRRRIALTDVEAVVTGALDNPLTYLGVVGEEGHPGLARITIRVYVSTDAEEQDIESAWREAQERSPLVRALSRLSHSSSASIWCHRTRSRSRVIGQWVI